MKRLLGYLALLVFATVVSAPVFAQDAAVLGTWKLNVEKSKFTGSPAPKELTRKIEADGDSVKYTYSGTAADGSAISYGFTVKFDGKDYPVTGSAPGGFDMISIKRINEHSYEATQKRAGKAAGTSKVAISKDGKVATVTIKGTDANGKAIGSTSVYEKQ
jgi:hypothetical protein